jgi:hypothetical protein
MLSTLNMALVALLFVFFAIFNANSIELKSLTDPSYGDLALHDVVLSFVQGVNSLINNLTALSMPESVRAMRTSLLMARSSLDIFVYAYPKTDQSSEEDTFRILRDDLDTGYTLIGNFQDLRNVNYTPQELEQSRQLCLSWKSAFLVNMEKYNYKNFIFSASTKSIINRKKSHLSKDYWGNVNATPTINRTGYQNIAVLAEGQTLEAVMYYDATYNLTDIWEPQYNDEFHDYRKLLRAIIYVGSTFPMIYSCDASHQILLMNTTFNQFGVLNDLVVVYAYYTKNGNAKKAQEVQNQISDAWTSEKSWLDSNKIRGVLQSLGTELIAH